MTPIGCRPRKFHTTVYTTAPNINNSVTLSQGYESTRKVPKCTWVPKPVISQDLTSFPTPTTIQSTQLSSTQPVPPKRMDLHPSLPRSPSGNHSPLFFGPPSQLVQKLNDGTLRTRSCEKNRAHENTYQTCRPQVTAGLHLLPVQPTIPWLILQQFGSLSQAETQMRMDQ
jgi:hypothetical protein